MLPRLRLNLDFMPSPVPEQPGLLIRDPFRYSDATLIVPPALVSCLEFFDGEKSASDLRSYLVHLTGDANSGKLEQHLTETLSNAGFLEDEKFQQMRAETQAAFAQAPIREASHAGAAYPDEPNELTAVLNEYMKGSAPEPASLLVGLDGSPLRSSSLLVGLDGAPLRTAPARKTVAIAAPHVSPFGGIDAYRAAYSALTPADADRTFVILGTSHYGSADRLGLTRKGFVTPFGEAVTDARLVDQLERDLGDAAIHEDYCHAVEHSIEFQVVFLQHLFGPRVKILPILCGTYARSLFSGGMPEDDESVRRIFGTLGDLAAREGDKLLWLLGVDMAHIGRRYGDPLTAIAGEGEMQEVEQRDRKRIDSMRSGDAHGFWQQVLENQDDLKWCGSAPIYTFLKAVPQARGELLRYQQWNIDDASVVSFAGMRFD
jgi:AmmeMemoRadiSam system protein B